MHISFIDPNYEPQNPIYSQHHSIHIYHMEVLYKQIWNKTSIFYVSPWNSFKSVSHSAYTGGEWFLFCLLNRPISRR